jgi:hypothetical protein
MTYLEGLPEPPAAGDAPAPAPGRGRKLGLVVASVAVVAGAAFAAVNVASGDANEPTDPVRAIFEAAEKGDAIGMLEQLEPGERDALRAPLVDLVDELNRLGILDDASLSELSGYDLEVRDLELAASEVREGVQAVRITGGSSEYAFDPSELPLGPFTLDLTGDPPEETTTGSSDLRSEGPDDEVVVVRRGDRWYVSLGYTIAEAARRQSGLTWEDLGPGVEPEGADSPEDAVRELLSAATELDPRRAVSLLPPGEMGALQDYAGLYLDIVEAGARMARGASSIEMPTLELDADTDGSTALVTIREIELTGSFEGGSFTYRDGCLEVAAPGEDDVRLCGDDPESLLDEYSGMTGEDLDIPEMPAFSFLDKTPDVGFVTTRVEGKWYVSPTRTLLDSVVAVLRVVEPSDLDKARDWWGELQETFATAFRESIEESMQGSFEEFEGDERFEIHEDDPSPNETTDPVPPGEYPVSVPRRM